MAPTIPHTPAPTAECSAENIDAIVSVTSDLYPEETSWTIENTFGTIIKSDEGKIINAKTEYIEDVCLDPLDCYTFTINDLYGDGIQRPGTFSLTVDGEVKLSNPKSDFSNLNVAFGQCEGAFCGDAICDINGGEGCGSCASDCVFSTNCNIISNPPTGLTYNNLDSYGMVFDVSVASRSVYFYELEAFIVQGSTAKVYMKEGPYSADADLKNWNLVFDGSISVGDYEPMAFDSRFYADAFSTVSFYISYGSPGAFAFTTVGDAVSNGDVTIQPGMLLSRQRGSTLPAFLSSSDASADFVDSIKYDYAQLPTPAPAVSPTTSCVDSEAAAAWCEWARKLGEAKITQRCEQKNLFQDCPKTCGTCT